MRIYSNKVIFDEVNKVPKIYFHGIGLDVYFVGIENRTSYEKSAKHGPLFKNFIVRDIKEKAA